MLDQDSATVCVVEKVGRASWGEVTEDPGLEGWSEMMSARHNVCTICSSGRACL